VEVVLLGDEDSPWGAVVLAWTSLEPDPRSQALALSIVEAAMTASEAIVVRPIGAAHPQPAVEATIVRMARVLVLEARNVLAGVDGALQIVGAGQGPSDPNRELLQVARGRLRNLCEWMMVPIAYGRPLDIVLERTDLRAVLRESVAALQVDRSRGATEILLIEGEAEALAEVDAVVLRLALDPMIQNALQAAGGTGSIRAGVTQDDQGWAVWVEDNGPGIAPDLRPIAAAPFVTTRPSGCRRCS
jgi:signal transduction histidine kinase